MNEEFIIRIGANARAMYSELQRASAYAKAWGTTLVEDFKSRIGRMFAAGFLADKAIETLGRVKDKILAIRRAQEELPGASSNFIQGIFNYADKIGLSYDSLSKPLLKFKQTLDAAKMNSAGPEMQTLIRYGIVTDANDLRNQKLSTSIGRLSEAYKKYGDNLKIVTDETGRASPAMIALLNLGPSKIEAMERGNVFTKLTPSTIEQFSALYSGSKNIGQIATSSIGNALATGMKFSPAAIGGRLMGQFSDLIASGQLRPMERLKQIWMGIPEVQEGSNEKLKESMAMEAQRVEANTKLLDLLERQRDLGAQIADQGKATVSQMATEARKLTGTPEPRLYGVSARMRTALQIDTIEKRAQIAYERGNDALHDSLWKQAQSMRASNTWLTSKDQNPMQRVENELNIVNQQLKPVSDMAAFVNQEHGSGSTKITSVPATAGP